MARLRASLAIPPEKERTVRRWLWYLAAYLLLIYIGLRLGGSLAAHDGRPIGD